MRSGFPLLVGLLLFTLVSADAVETYKIDPVHSSAGFKIKHLFAKLPGRFTDINGTIVGDIANPEETKVNVQINAASIVTNDAKRDEHLRSAEFFNVEEFPHITFTSKRVNRTGEDTAFVIGDLTMHGVTKETILQVKFLGRGKDAQGALRTGWEAKTALKRSDFGLTWSKAVEGTQVVGDDVEIELNIEAVEESAAAGTETTQVDPATKPPTGEPQSPTATIENPAVLPPPTTPAPAGVAETAGDAAQPNNPLGALPPGGNPTAEKTPAQPSDPAGTSSNPAVATPEVPKKTDAQSGNLPGAVPGEGSLPTVPNPATPSAPSTPLPVPPEPQPQTPATPQATETVPEPKPALQPAAGETEA